MNLLKPKKTSFNARALVYRRITRLEKSRQSLIVFKCLMLNSSYTYYNFDNDLQEFVSIDISTLVGDYDLVVVTSSTAIYQSGTNYFYWNTSTEKWVKSTTLPVGYTTLQDAGFSNIGTYQTNAYIYAGAIDYMIKGEVAGTTTQPIKGTILPLQSMNIQYFDDYINIQDKDLVVIDGLLYKVESPDFTIKHFPRPYKIYYATLNSIL